MIWKKIRPTFQNAAVQVTFWGAYCALISYASVYLQSRGLTDGQIGLVLALGNGLSVILQPLAGNFADSRGRMVLRRVLAACILPMLGLYFAVLAGASAPVCFILMIGLLQTVLPLLYTLCTFYMDRGVDIRFGVSRGLGSLGYAALSTVLGRLVAAMGPGVTVWVGIITLLLLLLAVATFRFRGVSDEKPVPEKSDVSIVRFLSRNPRFSRTLAGAILAYVGYNVASNFLFQILSAQGLGAEELGYCLMLSSLVELPTLFLLSFLNRHFFSGHLLKVGAVFLVVKTAAMIVATGFGGVMAAMALQILGYPLFASIGVYFVNQVIDETHRTLGQSLMNDTFTLSNVIACLLGGWLLDLYGVRTMLIVAAVISATGAAIVIFFAQRGGKLPARSVE